MVNHLCPLIVLCCFAAYNRAKPSKAMVVAMDQKVRLASCAFLFYWVFHPALVKMPLIFVRLFLFFLFFFSVY